jgi:Nif-specific regulatory protein
MNFDPNHYQVLIVDDEQDNLDAFRFNFKRGFNIQSVDNGEEALELLKKHDFAVIVTDQRMPKMTGLELLHQAQAIRPDAVGIILTAYTDVDVLMEAINQGTIYRYITKPWDAKEVRGLLVQAMERFHLLRENRRLTTQLQQYTGYLNNELHSKFDFGQIIGGSAALNEVMENIEQVAPTASTVLLRGETGTGKELVAHAIHINSPREDKPFVRVNCASLAQGVLESELFGHEKGAFTGAINQRAGRFELADGGTLFLDEVGDLPMDVQIKLLRTLQEREFERVGGSETIRVDVRVVSATNRNLEEMIESGDFREDLYYRLNVFPVHLPPLRERHGDLPLLVNHFISKFAAGANKQVEGYTEEAMVKMQGYSWPGNVRELENIIERAMILVKGSQIEARNLAFSRLGNSPTGTVSTVSDGDTGSGPVVAHVEVSDGSRPLGERLQDREKQEIIAAVEKSNSNIAGAARLLGINRSTLYYRMRKLGLEHLLPTKVAVGGTPAEAEPPVSS